MEHEHKLLTARLTRSVLLSEKTKHLEFVVEELDTFEFEAGQFVSVREPHGGKTITRAYSVASPPRGDDTFDLCLNRVDEGFMSNYLCDLMVGESAHFHGPHGLFVIKPEVWDRLMICTGAGELEGRAGLCAGAHSQAGGSTQRSARLHLWAQRDGGLRP